MQGRLRKNHLSVKVKSECAHCSEAIEFDLDSDLNLKMAGGQDPPLIFVPDVDLHNLDDDSIIQQF